MARCGVLDVSRDERGYTPRGRTLRFDEQPQLRRTSGQGRTNASGQPFDGGGRSDRGAFRGRASLGIQKIGTVEKFNVHSGQAVVIDRPNIDTEHIIPKKFLKGTART